MARHRKGHSTMGMVEKTSEVAKAYGQDLDTPIKFSYKYEELEKYEDIPEKELPDNDEVLTMVNARRNASARAAAQTKALSDAGINKPTLDDPKVQFTNIAKSLEAAGKSRDEARQTANALLGTDF